jgi:hypothetical protein
MLNHNNVNNKYLTLKQLSEYSSISVPSLRRYIRTEKLPYFRINRIILIDPNEFDHWLIQRRKEQNIQKDAQDQYVRDIIRRFKP